MQGRASSYIQGRVNSLIAVTVAVSVVALVLLHIAYSEEALGGAQVPAAPEKLNVSPKDWTKKDKFSVSWNNPKSESQVTGVYYKLGSAPKGPEDGTYTSLKKDKKKGSIKGIEVGKPGDHPIYVWLKDGAGNVSEKNSATGSLKFDDTSPAVPASFRESPGGWNSSDSFSVSWDSAASTDAAPIVGAYYKLDKPPERERNGTYVELGDGSRSSIQGIAVDTEGIHQIYVWLKDAAGNISEDNLVEGHLNFDKTPPEVPQNLTLLPFGWATENNFTVSWINPDTSGVAPITGAYYKVGALPSEVDDGSYSKLSSKDRRVALYGLQVPTAGKHAVHVWLKDAAGNVSHENLTSGYLLYAPKVIEPPKRSQPRKPIQKPPESDPLDGGTDSDSGSASPGLGEGIPSLDPPLITAVGVTRKYFRVSSSSSSGDMARWKQGTQINYTLSESSKTTFTVVRNVSGWKRGGSCTKASRKLRKKRSKCSRYKTVGSFTRQGQSGDNSTKFSGKLNGKRLKPGLYHVYVHVGNGMNTPAPLIISFRVVRGR